MYCEQYGIKYDIILPVAFGREGIFPAQVQKLLFYAALGVDHTHHSS